MADLNTITSEIWRPVPTWEGSYEVNQFGQIRSIRTKIKKIRGHFIGKQGHIIVSIKRGSRSHKLQVAKTVAQVFLGDCPPLHKLAFKDGCVGNIAFSNLEYIRADVIPHNTCSFCQRAPLFDVGAVLGYAAGMLDGEGSIIVVQYKRKHTSMIVVVNTDYRVIQWLLSHFGGSHGSKAATEVRRVCYRWIISCNQAAAFLEHVRPYLVIKPQQADIMLTLQRHIRTNVGKGQISDEVFTYREGLRRELRSLTLGHKGRVEPI
jgi:hypothetical protein